MRSVYTKVLLWSLATLGLSMGAWMLVDELVYQQLVGKDSFFDRMQTLELENLRVAYESGGEKAAAMQIERSARILGGEHHFLDRRGVDLISGEDLSALVAKFRFEKRTIQKLDGRTVSGIASSDGKYRFLVFGPSPLPIGRYITYYLPIVAVVGLLCWVLASRISSPLRQLARAVDRFGRGDLTARANSRRRDEIGELGMAFDRMAERIGGLLTSERRLLQDISHELRSPLARLKFASELVRISDDREAAVARLNHEIERLSDLVSALIETTRAEDEGPSVGLEPLYIDEVLGYVIQDCRLEADARRCDIAFALAPAVAVEGNRELLRRAVENVLRNAIRYTPEESVIDVQLKIDEDRARISVRDYGPGVPDEALDKIFQPFFRVDDSRTSSTGGVGLGLTIAHHAIGAHRGEIRAENAHPGLRVWLEIPVPKDKPGVRSRSAVNREESALI